MQHNPLFLRFQVPCTTSSLTQHPPGVRHSPNRKNNSVIGYVRSSHRASVDPKLPDTWRRACYRRFTRKPK